MSTAAVSSTSIFQELQNFYQARQTDVAQLGSDIKSGNLSAAQQDFTTLAALGESGPFSNSEPFSNSTRAQDFNTIGEALQAGDLGRAQTAFAALTGQTSTTTAATSNPATVVNLASTQPSTDPPTASSTTSIYQQLQAYRQQRTSDLAQLGQDLQGSNLSAAQSDFNTLTALGQTGPNVNGQTYQQSSRNSDFQAIGQALQNGDLAGAETAYTALASSFGKQNPQAQTAISAYNPGVTEIVINLGASTAVSSARTASSTNSSSSSSSGSSIPELVINLGGTSAAYGNSNSPVSPLVINLNEGGSSSSGTSTTPEIVINLGAASSTNSSTGSPATSSGTSIGTSTGTSSAPELVINLNEGNSSSTTATNDVTTISLANTSSGEQLTIAGPQGQNGSSAQPVTINLNPQDSYELIFNLLNSPSSTSSSSNALSVSA